MTESTSDLPESEIVQKIGPGKVLFSDQRNSFRYANMEPGSFTVDMEGFAHLTSKDANLNSRINLQRSLSRKGSQRWGDKKMNVPTTGNERDSDLIASSSPRDALVGAATPEKPMVVTVGTADQPVAPQVHHQITIVTGHVPVATTTTATTERRLSGKRFSFRRTSSSLSWTLDPRRILFFFATLSSMGTILLIYFTLSMSKISTADDSMLN